MPEAAAKVPVKMTYRNEVTPTKTVKDNMYGTGEWDYNEVKLVEPAIAAKLVRHIDVYTLVTPEEAADANAVEVVVALDKGKDELDKLSDASTQELRDRVAQMDRETARKYGAEHYKLTIPGNLSTEATRARLIQHIDIAGAA